MTRIISINVAAIRKGIRKVPKTPELKEPIRVLKKQLSNYEKHGTETLRPLILVSIAKIEKLQRRIAAQPGEKQ